MAIRRENPGKSLIHHSDRGLQYAARDYQAELLKHGILSSMSRKGDPDDNAVAENFFSCLKCETVHLSSFKSREKVSQVFYNTQRPHSSLGYLSPLAFKKTLANLSKVA